MFPPFSQSIARHYNRKLISEIEAGIFNLNQVTQISREREGSGIMLGTLVCWNKEKSERVVLHVVSGISKELVHSSGNTEIIDSDGIRRIIVESIADSKLINQALEKNDRRIHELTEQINNIKTENNAELQIQKLKQQRTELTTESLQNVFNLYNFTRFDGKQISLNRIIELHGGKLPPTGTGDCCAPKLFSYAFKHNLQIVSMNEIFYGKDTKNKVNLQSYGPCDERCGYILPEILGVEILYRDTQIAVLKKPSGLLSVPGKGVEKADCVESRIKNLFPECIKQPAVHRLDMETSGILVVAFTKEAHKNLNMQFAEGQVHKKYVALLDGILEKAEGKSAPKHGEKQGRMELKFRVDLDNRPYQIYDEVYGKTGITEWQNCGLVQYENPVTKEKKKVTKIIFTPLTGRTHQLRLAAASEHGFGLPIIGDSLYGKKEEGMRLMLHAFEIEFFHPVSGELLHFNSEESNF